MSNSTDVAMWGLGLGDACPSLATIQAALAAHVKPFVLPAGCELIDVPGVPKCLVRLTGQFTAPEWAETAYAIAEVRDAFPKDSAEFKFLAENIAAAGTLQILAADRAFIPVCKYLKVDGKLGENVTGIRTQACPTKRQDGSMYIETVAQAQQLFGSYPPSVIVDPSGHKIT
jgi:hypothetical protein